MLGVKINEFDNSDGTIKSFNKLFPRTVLGGFGDVEILGIVDKRVLTENSPYVRIIEVNGVTQEHDFGEKNFRDGEMFNNDYNIRFKYLARNLEGKVIAKAYGCEDLASKLDCHISVIKRRLIKDVGAGSNTTHLFNVTRQEL